MTAPAMPTSGFPDFSESQHGSMFPDFSRNQHGSMTAPAMPASRDLLLQHLFKFFYHPRPAPKRIQTQAKGLDLKLSTTGPSVCLLIYMHNKYFKVHYKKNK